LRAEIDEMFGLEVASRCFNSLRLSLACCSGASERVDRYMSLLESGMFVLFKVLGFRVRVRSDGPSTECPTTKTARVAQKQKTRIPDFIEPINLVFQTSIPRVLFN
jgi:hypothetical protein